MKPLRDYQQDGSNGIDRGFADGHRGVVYICPTGGGKTVVMSKKAEEHDAPGLVSAHRQELISQISCAFADRGIPHDVICNDATRRNIVRKHMRTVGRNYIAPRAAWRIGGVDTVVNSKDDRWHRQVTFLMQDEAHHVVQGNKWGRQFEMFPNARYLGVTAWPERADGKGIGAASDGYFNVAVAGPKQRTLIERGYLTEYEIYSPTAADLNLTEEDISEITGDFVVTKARKAVHKSTRLVGDVVRHYKELANGKLGVTFCVDIESATEIAAAYRKAGVTAEVLSGKTPDDVRAMLLEKFEKREIMQLCSVDIMGEGFDLPAIEVASFARPTASFSVFVQQFGRVLRLLEGKLRAIIIDHVGNVIRHAHWDDEKQVVSLDRPYSIERRDRRSKKVNDAIPLRICDGCTKQYPRVRIVCPYCGAPVPEPAQRSTPAFVDGDLKLLDGSFYASSGAAISKINGAIYPPAHLPPAAKVSIIRNHNDRYSAHWALREIIDLWAGVWKQENERERYKRFFLTFGTDVLSALGMNAADANALRIKILANLSASGYDTSKYSQGVQQ